MSYLGTEEKDSGIMQSAKNELLPGVGCTWGDTSEMVSRAPREAVPDAPQVRYVQYIRTPYSTKYSRRGGRWPLWWWSLWRRS